MRFFTVVLAVALLTACGAKRPMETLPKFDNELVSKVNTDSDFLYLISVSDADSNSQASRPHFMSITRTVRYKFTKTSLDVVQTVDDPRFKNNPTNEKPILSIPVQYLNYKCRENDFKECTNKEEVDETVDWNQKKYFKPDFAKLEISEVSSLPLAADDIGMGCYTNIGQKLISSELKEESLNVEVERTYRAAKPSCMEGIVAGTEQEFLDQLTFKVRYRISMAKLSSITDPKYKEVLYPQKDESTFGFFTTKEAKLDIDNRPMADKAITKLNRWSPNKKELVYYLNEAFERPEYQKIKQATFKVADAINDGLKKAGAGIHFSLKSATPGMSGEDLRQSMIIMVPEAMDSGLLGYGPTAVNPRTGEIVHARVVMYLGNMKEFIYRTWDELIDEQVQKSKAASQGNKQAEAHAQGKINFSADSMMMPELKLPQHKISYSKVGNKFSVSSLKNLQTLMKSQATNKRTVIDLMADKDQSTNKEMDLDEYLNKYQSTMEYYTRNNYYPGDLFSFENAIMAAYKGKIPDRLRKSWAQLTEVERTEVIDLVLPVIWSTTLIHEAGHTFGLRHNFNGSEDKANFYTEDELKAMGINYPINISSVMEYPFDDISALPVMGKYDIAALRFGYARKAELADGTLVNVGTEGLESVGDKQKGALKKYGYCTDEHVEVNPGCKRFDTGTTLTEIAQHEINVYERYYKYRNFRTGRRFFNTSSDAGYMSRMAGTFKYMRLFLDRYQDVQKNLPDVNSWDSDTVDPDSRAFLKDLKQAVTLIGNHFLDVLVEPDVTCVYKDKETSKYGIMPLVFLTDSTSTKARKQFNPNLYSCLRDLQSNDKIEWVGQFGRYFNSRKDPETGNPYIDEIDTRGIMIDKLLASHFLLTRGIGSNKLNENIGNYLDVPEVRDRLIKMYFSLMLDEVPIKASIPLTNGDTYIYEGPITLSISHILRPSGSSRVDRLLGIRKSKRFYSNLLNDMGVYSAKGPDRQTSLETYQMFAVYHNLTDTDLKNKSYEVMPTTAGDIYYIFPENMLARIVYERWSIAKQMEGVPDQVFEKIAELLKKKVNADQATKDIETVVKDLKIKDDQEEKETLARSQAAYSFFAKSQDGDKILNFVMSGYLKEPIYYEDLMAALPSAR